MHARILIAICVLLATATALATTKASTTSDASTTTSTPPPTSTIPPGYTYYSATRSYYKLHESYVSWYVASTTCAGEGAHLVVLNDAEEADILARIVRGAVSGYRYIWTGLRDNRPGGVMDWRTVHGEPLSDVYNMWTDGDPENNPQYKCAFFGAGNKRLRDGSCDWMSYFICEISQ